MLSSNDLEVLETATAAARRLEQRRPPEDFTHTVVSSARDTSGRMHTAVNVHHFTGGPCAELVVAGLAASLTADRLEVIVAVASSDLAVLAPCGRCRQVLTDLYPDVRVIIDGPRGAEVVPAIELLPHAYRQPTA
ncbi:hypothetical protein WDZ17_16845 [Pseudokineococcus basanitobsidens]|uniref:CMP/dCMP-type deaminase domain-containing protein n=1 Tax=Pseudokineococcus basanitobsidens TaxID=1926649 RepID=A0ABU8RPH4_9ACTN